MNPDAPAGSPWPPAPPDAPPPTSRFGGVAIAVGATLVAATVATAAGAFAFRPHVMRVPGESMAPGVQGGQYVLVVEAVGELRRGDVVVMRSPVRRDYLRRVVVLPREVFAIVDGRVRIAGASIDEPYVAPDRRSHEHVGPFTVPAGEYYLLGDNRADSLDSRYEGTVPRDRIWGRRVW